MEDPLPRVLFVLGAPGSGKGTVCASLVRDLGVVHLSAGDLLREEKSREDSQHGKLINDYIKEGKIVPVAITVSLLWREIVKGVEKGKLHFLVDGFPRNEDNLRGWEQVVGRNARVVGVLFLDAPEAVVEARLLERGKTSGRSDDNLESIKKRFVTYTNETRPILDHYSAMGMSWRVDANQPKEAVLAQVMNIVEDRFIPKIQHVCFVLGGPGAGKGTQCSRSVLNHKLDLTHLSAGDLLRTERERLDSPDGALIAAYIKEGKIVPVEISVRLLLKAMQKCGTRNILVDGFPRNMDNVQGWNKHTGSTALVKGCVFLSCSEPIMEARLLERGKTSGRADDNIVSIRKRFKTFIAETLPVVQLFKDSGDYHEIDAGRTQDEVFTDFSSTLKRLFDSNRVVKMVAPEDAAAPVSATQQEPSSSGSGSKRGTSESDRDAKRGKM